MTQWEYTYLWWEGTTTTEPVRVYRRLVCTGCCGVMSIAVDGFVFDWGVHSDTRVAALTVVEDLKVLEDRVGEFDTCLPPLSVQQFDLHPGPERFDHRVVEAPIDPTEGRSPESLAPWVNAHDVNCVPWCEWITVASVGFRLPIAIPNADVTRVAVADESIDHPTTRRLNVSNTTAQ